jgi:undecaprenyl-diphosphatase
MLAYLAIRLVQSSFTRTAIIVGAAFLISGIALSRVYFGVHFPTDIVGGLLAGALWLTAIIVMLQVADWEIERRGMVRVPPA